MEIVKSGSLADVVFEQLENEILSGEYKEGDILTELSLSKKLNVSRTPIREAIRRLQQENLVKDIGKGVRVVGLTIKDLEDIYEIRSRVEGLAAKKCAENISQEGIDCLSEIIELQEFYTAKGSAESIMNYDSEFHKIIYEICGSDTYSAVLGDLHKRVRKFRTLSVKSADRAKKAHKEHLEIFKAIKSKNGLLAEQLTIKHIINAKNSILKNLE